jgi:chromosome partitioning protein
MPAVRIVAVINQKGGVGKTTTVANLGAALAAAGRDVCLIDLDPQAHLTLHLGLEPGAADASVYDMLTADAAVESAARPVAPRLWVVPSAIDLAAAEVELVGTVGREQILRDRLRMAPAGGVLASPVPQAAGGAMTPPAAAPASAGLQECAEPEKVAAIASCPCAATNGAAPPANTPSPEQPASPAQPAAPSPAEGKTAETSAPRPFSPVPFSPARCDFVLIDCPPSLGLLTLNALAAADDVLIPLQPHFLALQGMGKLLETVSLVQRRINPSLRICGVVLCLYETGTKLAAEVMDDLRQFFTASRDASAPWATARIFQSVIRRNVKLAESPSHGKTIFDYDPRSRGADDYHALAREFLSLYPASGQVT